MKKRRLRMSVRRGIEISTWNIWKLVSSLILAKMVLLSGCDWHWPTCPPTTPFKGSCDSPCQVATVQSGHEHVCSYYQKVCQCPPGTNNGGGVDMAPSGPSLSLVAGGLGGPGFGDGTGATARFYSPYGVAVDGSGTLFVTDANNHTIRKVAVATGVVTTLVGAAGVSGNADGIKTAARFNAPAGVAVDDAGNLFVADANNHTIRKVTVGTGAVTTLAGTAGMLGSTDGTGASARFNYPSGVALDGVGNLFVADRGNHTIRMVVVATGVVTTLVGTAGMSGSADGTGTAARFNNPNGVAVDIAGNLFVADTNNYTIRKVEVSSGVVTTLVGTTGSVLRFSDPIGVAVDGAGSLFIAGTGSSTIWKVAVGVVTALVGSGGGFLGEGSTDGTGSAARFKKPAGVAVDGSGNLFVADTGNNTIRKVVMATRAVTTLVGTAGTGGSTDDTGAAARFNQPSGVAVDGVGNLFVADTSNYTIRKVVVDTGIVTTVAGVAGLLDPGYPTGRALFRLPSGLAADVVGGDLFITDEHKIRKMVMATGTVTTLAGNSSGSTDGMGIAASFQNPTGLAVGPAGILFVADTGNHTIRLVQVSTGVVKTLVGTAGMPGSADGTGTAARFNQPTGLAVDGAGNLFVADTGNHTIRKVVVGTGAVTTPLGIAGMTGKADGLGTAARFNRPSGLTVDGAGKLIVADTGNNTIRKIALSNGSVSTQVGIAGQGGVVLGLLPARLNQPAAVAVLPSGRLFILDENSVLSAY